MTKFLGKDERLALIAEFDQGLPSSNPLFKVIKNKNGIYNIRQVKEKKPDEVPIEYSDAVKLAMSTIENELGAGAVRLRKPQTPREPVILSESAKDALVRLEAEIGCKVRIPKNKPTNQAIPPEDIISAPEPTRTQVPKEPFRLSKDKPKAL